MAAYELPPSDAGIAWRASPRHADLMALPVVSDVASSRRHGGGLRAVVTEYNMALPLGGIA